MSATLLSSNSAAAESVTRETLATKSPFVFDMVVGDIRIMEVYRDELIAYHASISCRNIKARIDNEMLRVRYWLDQQKQNAHLLRGEHRPKI